jgi:hypothetical protein
MMQRPNGGSPKIPPEVPQKESGKGRRRPESWQNSNSETGVAAPVPINPYQRPRKQQAVGGLTQIAANMVRGKAPVPVKPVAAPVPVRPNANGDDDLTNENVNAVLLTNENLQNTSSYLDEISSLLKSYNPTDGKRIAGDQATRDAKAQRDFRSLLGYIDRIERDYIIPDSIADFVKAVRMYESYPEKVNEQLMNQISQEASPMFNEFAQHISRKTLGQMGPKKGGRRTRRRTQNRHRRRSTHRRR